MFKGIFGGSEYREFKKLESPVLNFSQRLIILADFLENFIKTKTQKQLTDMLDIDNRTEILETLEYYTISSITYTDNGAQTELSICNNRDKNYLIIKKLLYEFLIMHDTNFNEVEKNLEKRFCIVSPDSRVAFAQMLAESLYQSHSEYKFEQLLKVISVYEKWNELVHIGVSGISLGLNRISLEEIDKRFKQVFENTTIEQKQVVLSFGKAMANKEYISW